MRKNLSIVIVIGVFIAFLIPSIKTYQQATINMNQAIKSRNNLKELCKKEELPTDFCDNYFEANDLYSTYMENINVHHFRQIAGSFFEIMYLIFPFLIPWLVIRPCFKSKQLENQLVRRKYKDICKSFLKEAYKVIWIVPCIFLILHFIGYARLVSIETTPLSIFLSYLPNILAHLLIISININFALILARFCHKFFSYLLIGGFSYISITLLLQELSNYLYLEKNMNVIVGITYPMYDRIKLFNLWGLGIIVLISWGLLYLVYRNKEKLVIACEKNN